MTCPWIEIGRQYIGLTEIKGPRTAPFLARWLAKLRASWSDDETPWCGVYLAGVMADAGFTPPPGWARARSWLDWGPHIASPAVGCIAVFERGSGGHVGIVLGETDRGHLRVLGGNQRDAVSVALFDRSRVLAYVWPPGFPLPSEPLPKTADAGPLSVNEA